MMLWILVISGVTARFTNGETIIKRNGMMYHIMRGWNSTWEPEGDWNSTALDSIEDQVENFYYTGSNGQCQCGWTNSNSRVARKHTTRIIGGDFYPTHKYPFVAEVAQKAPNGWKPFCGGSIITNRHVLTAAHCINDVAGLRTQLAALLGTHDMTKPDRVAEAIPVTNPVVHWRFNSQTLDYDIAILPLSKTIVYNPAIGPVCIPSPTTPYTDEQLSTVKIIGWGAQKVNSPMSMVPKEMDAKVVLEDKCSSAWPGILPLRGGQICTYSPNASPCKGDSGGPVVWLNPKSRRYSQFGIVSFGPQCSAKKPSVHTRVTLFNRWILEVISETFPSAELCNC